MRFRKRVAIGMNMERSRRIPKSGAPLNAPAALSLSAAMPEGKDVPKVTRQCCCDVSKVLLFGQCMHWRDLSLRTMTISVMFENVFLMFFGWLTGNVLHFNENRGTYMILFGQFGMLSAVLVISNPEKRVVLRVAMVLLALVAIWWVVSIVTLLFTIEHTMDESPPPAPPAPVHVLQAAAAHSAAPAGAAGASSMLQSVAAAGRSLHEIAVRAVALDAARSGKTVGDHLREWIIVSYDVVLVVVQTCTIINHLLLMYTINKVLWKRGQPGAASSEDDPLLKGMPKGVP